MLLLGLPAQPEALRVDFYCRRCFLWVVDAGSSSCSLPCCLYREKPFLQDSGPSLPASIQGCVPSTSEAPRTLHLLFICVPGSDLCRSFSPSVGRKGHPEPFCPSSSSPSPSLGCVTLSLQALLPGLLWELIFFMDQRELGGKAETLPLSLGEIPFSWVIPGRS